MTATFQDDDSFERMILSFKQGDQACLGQLYDKYAPALLGVITRILENPELAADCLQQAFNEIWKEKASYDLKKERLFTWMMKFARNSALNFLKNGHDFFPEPGISGRGEDSLKVEKEDHLEGKEFEVAPASPVPQQNNILELVYIKGFTFAEASGRLNIPIETAKLQFIVAIKQLKTKVSA